MARSSMLCAWKVLDLVYVNRQVGSRTRSRSLTRKLLSPSPFVDKIYERDVEGRCILGVENHTDTKRNKLHEMAEDRHG